MKYQAIVATEAPCRLDKPKGLIQLECLSIYAGMPLPDKLPFLDLHKGGQSCILGHAENLRVELVEAGGVKLNAIVGEIIFSKAYAGCQAEINVLGGHVWGLSAGYEIYGSVIVEHGKEREINGILYPGGKRIIDSFELREVSLTPLPKDKNCKIIIINQEHNHE